MYDYDWKLFNQHHLAELKKILTKPENKIDFSLSIGSIRIGDINVNIGPEHLESNNNSIVAGFSMFYPHNSMDFHPPCGQEIEGMLYDYAEKAFFSLKSSELEDVTYKDFTKTVEEMLEESIKKDNTLSLSAISNTNFWQKYDVLNITRKISNRECLSNLQKEAGQIELA